MVDQLRDRLEITPEALDAINKLLLDPNSRVVNDFLAVVAKYGTPEEINRKDDLQMRGPDPDARMASCKRGAGFFERCKRCLQSL